MRILVAIFNVENKSNLYLGELVQAIAAMFIHGFIKCCTTNSFKGFVNQKFIDKVL